MLSILTTLETNNINRVNRVRSHTGGGHGERLKASRRCSEKLLDLFLHMDLYFVLIMIVPGWREICQIGVKHLILLCFFNEKEESFHILSCKRERKAI